VTEFLTVDDALEVARLVTGESPRVRDFADLQAALTRPQQTENGRELFPGIWDKAAALMESLGHSYAHDLVRGTLTAPAVAEQLRKFAA